MSVVEQSDYGAGIFRGVRAPAGCVYDCEDGLIDDENAIYRRGGGAYQSSDVGAALRGIADGQVAPGGRTVMWTAGGVFILSPGDDTTPVQVNGLTTAGQMPRPWARAFGMSGLMAFKTVNLKAALLYGGATKTSWSAGTISTTIGDETVTGLATGWLANVEPGMILFIAGVPLGVVAQVVSDTAIEMQDPALVTVAGSAYLARSWDTITLPSAIPAGQTHIATVGSPPRLVLTIDNRAYLSVNGQWWSFTNTDYHELPPPGTIIGADAVRDVLVLFSTDGVWTADNMNLDLTDANGDVQQHLQQISKDVRLWDDNGVAGLSTYAALLGWQGQLIVPALDDVYMLGVDAPAVAISRGIRPLYRSYVAAGHKLGTACIYRGHYFLPVLDTSNQQVDCFVCRLDQRDRRGQLRPAWTRLSGFVFGGAFTGRARAGLAPRLLGTKSTRATDLTGIFSPAAGNKNDGDGVTHDLTVVENDVESGNRSTVTAVDLHYELQDAAADNPTIEASFATGSEGSSWTPLGDDATENYSAHDLERRPKRWRLVVRTRNVRMRWVSSGPSARLRIRRRVYFIRDSNRP